MLSGKTVDRAVRGHLPVDTALNAMVISSALNIDPQLFAPAQPDASIHPDNGSSVEDTPLSSVEDKTLPLLTSLLEVIISWLVSLSD